MNATRRRARAALLTFAAAAVLLAAACSERGTADAAYHCPMHPTYVSDQAGDCPICGMRLVPIPTRPEAAAAATYICPMCPEVTSTKADDRCPQCGMFLVAAETTATTDLHAQHADATAGVPGMAAVELAERGLELAGVQTATAGRGALARSLRTVGRVVADETRVHHVHTKISGWVEQLHANFTGQLVRAGEPILSVYSPELLATQEELLRARATAARFAASALPEVRRGGDDLLAAARRRLELLDVPPSFVAELEASGVVQRSVTLLAPSSGYVSAKEVVQGHRVEPGMELFTITDLSWVWVEAEVYEVEAAALRVGIAATISLPFDPSARRPARVSFVAPTLDPASRTLTVRFELANPDLTFKPGMFADVELTVDGDVGVVIPDSAVLDTGARQVVFVRSGAGSFVPREVVVAVRSQGQVRVSSGLAAGEEVVIRANFLLDSESRLRAALAGLGSGHPHGGGS